MQKKRKVEKELARYQQIIDFEDNKINVLVLGVSGCGKSTLINGLLEEKKAKTGVGSAVTENISIYENDKIPFRLIDTVGFEYGFFRQNKIKGDLAKFCKEGVKNSELEKLIHMIWFCIDGTTKRVDQVVLDYIKHVTNDWKDVPIIIVFTKSYSEPEIAENIDMAQKAVQIYNKKHKRGLNVVDIIPVVAKEYQINEETYVLPKGLDRLVNRTNELTPEAKQIAEKAIKEIDIKLKGRIANSNIAASTAAAVTVGAVPIIPHDAPFLVAIQSRMLNSLADTYGISNNSETNQIIDTVLKVGATTTIGKAILKSLKAIPGLSVAATLLNASVAGVITFAAGEVSKVMFERVYRGDIDSASIDYEKEITELFKKYLPKIIKGLEDFTNNNEGRIKGDDIRKFITSLLQ